MLEALSEEKLKYAVSTALILEYEGVLMRHIPDLWMTDQQLQDFLDAIVSLGERCTPYFLWRPYLSDPKYDHVLELAVSANAKYIVTYNISDFRGIDKFVIKAIKPYDYLRKEKLI